MLSAEDTLICVDSYWYFVRVSAMKIVMLSTRKKTVGVLAKVYLLLTVWKRKTPTNIVGNLTGGE